ncbi:glycosyltransferase family 2 protein [Deinococcus hopiensis]|uniref:Glycosyltransferase, catalytic subunit of cellulose synthase and poly-beta-1,6-N-acetylglucosamine synthase n=1 Tax=Deinococcus hopiensis KR-140 TaxID=695939 RepID=A0A1W1VM05_9DEIO|nr:glycosyltransferase [Deinococcus hopiensis]SMB94358.1 Glycosyltransferase, catalytic subunit of cellulose synthase and poly-beta-1,6-N-acetylglucosamine synthase [Deinococcus hopiensis KR-140]
MKTLFSVLDLISLLLFVLYATQQVLSALQRRPKPPVAGEGARLTFLIPALNEAGVIGPTLDNLRRTVPGARLVVIDDASDDGTAEIVAELAARDPQVLLLRRHLPGARQNKSRAMKWAVEHLLTAGPLAGRDLTQEVLVVLDADGQIGPDFAPQVRGAFADPDVMAAQGWMRFRQTGAPGGWAGVWSRMLLFQQDLETFIVGRIQRLRALGHTVALTGNGQCMRASYVAAQLARGVDPWPDVLLEDFASALEVRLHDPRWKIALLTAKVTQQGMVASGPLIRQRARWTQGAMQCLPYLPRLWRSPAHPVTRVEFSYFILAPWLNMLLILSVLSQPVRRVLGEQGLAWPTWLGTVFTVLPLALQLNWALRYRAERGLSWWTVPYTLLSLPVYTAALLSSTFLAYRNHFTGRQGWYKSVRHDEPGGQELSPPEVSSIQPDPHLRAAPQRSRTVASSGD